MRPQVWPANSGNDHKHIRSKDANTQYDHEKSFHALDRSCKYETTEGRGAEKGICAHPNGFSNANGFILGGWVFVVHVTTGVEA